MPSIALIRWVAHLITKKEHNVIQMMKMLLENGPKAGVMQRKFLLMLATLMQKSTLFV